MWTSDIERLIRRLSVLSPYVKEFGFQKPEFGKFLVEVSGIRKFVLVESRILGLALNPRLSSRDEYKLHTEYVPSCSTRWNDCLSNIILIRWYISLFRPKGENVLLHLQLIVHPAAAERQWCYSVRLATRITKREKSQIKLILYQRTSSVRCCMRLFIKGPVPSRLSSRWLCKLPVLFLIRYGTW